MHYKLRKTDTKEQILVILENDQGWLVETKGTIGKCWGDYQNKRKGFPEHSGTSSF